MDLTQASSAGAPPTSTAAEVGAPARARNDTIDALKYVAMALVIFTHVLRLYRQFIHLSPDTLRIIVSFNMPLFAFLSGWVLFGREGSGPVRFVRNKALSLLVPYLAWIAVEMPLRHVPPSGYLARLGSALLDPIHGMQMWFLWTLFAMFLVFTLGRQVSRSDWWTGGLAVSIGAIALVIPGGASGLDRIVWLYPYFVLGYLVAKHRVRLRRFDAAVTVVALVAFAGLSVAVPTTLPARIAAGVAGTAAACGIFRFLPAAPIRALAAPGRRTLGVYGWQMVVFPFLVVGAGWTGALATWAIVLAVATALTFALERFAFTRAVFLGQWPRGWLKRA